MWSEIGKFLADPLFSGYVGSPLAGLLLTALLAGLTSSPQPGAPQTVPETIIVVEKYYYIDSAKDTSGSMAFIVLLLCVGVWWMVNNTGQVFQTLIKIDLTVLVLLFVPAIFLALKHHVTSLEWIFYLGLPIVFLLISLLAVSNAQQTFDPEITEAARKSQGLLPFLLNDLSSYGRAIVFLNSVVLFFNLMLQPVALLLSYYYLSLASLRGFSPKIVRGIWRLIYSKTRRFANPATFILIIFLSTVSLLALNSIVVQYFAK